MTKEGNSGEAAAQENSGGDTPAKDANADIFENRGSKKIIRLVTVMAYMFSVSFVAIVLSAYYLFLWKPPNPRLIRRNHLEADPQVQFLLSDAPILPNQSDEDLDEISTNSLYKGIMTDYTNLNSTHPMIVGRIAGDTFDVNDTTDTHEYDNFINRKKFYKPLLILRNNLMDMLRGRVLYSNDNENSPDAESSQKMGPKSTKNETLENEVSNRIMPYFQTKQSSIDDNNTSLKPKSLTIFRDPANKGLFTSEANGTKPGFVQKILPVEDDSKRNVNVQKENQLNYGKSVEIIDIKSSRNANNSEENTFGNYTDIQAPLKNESLNSSNNGSMNSNIKTVKTKKLSAYHSRSATGVTIIKSDEAESIAKDLPSEIDISARKRKIGILSRSTEFGDRLVSSQRLDFSSATTLTKIAMNSGETQMERMTAKLTTARNELSELDVETTTIKRPRDILTILTESTSATKMPLGTSSSTVSEEPQTDFSPTTQSHSENTT